MQGYLDQDPWNFRNFCFRILDIYACMYFFLGRVHSFCHILKGLSHDLQNTENPSSGACILNGGGIAPPHTQEVKNWFRDGNLRYYNVYVLPKGHSTYAETQNIGDIKISCIGGGQLGKNVRWWANTKKQTDVQTEVPKCTSNTSSVQRTAEY